MEPRPLNLSLADTLVATKNLIGQNLTAIERVIDWKPLQNLLKPLIHPEGRPPYPPLAMLKALLLGRWYNLSDPALEARLDDSLAFRKFCGFALDLHVPDHATLCRFRQKLADNQVLEPMLAELDRQFVQAGWVLREGTIVDATVIRSAATPPPREPDGSVGVCKQDPEAGWRGSRTGKATFGYMAHVGADKTSGLVRKVIVRPGNENEAHYFEDCLSGDEREVYADSAYSSNSRHQELAERGQFDGILKRNYRCKTLTEAEVERNAFLSAIRKQVEKIFGVMKRSYGLGRVTVFGQERVTSQVFLTVIAYNLRRAMSLYSV